MSLLIVAKSPGKIELCELFATHKNRPLDQRGHLYCKENRFWVKSVLGWPYDHTFVRVYI